MNKNIIPVKILKTIAALPGITARQAALTTVIALSHGATPQQVLWYLVTKYGAPIASRNAGAYQARPNNEMTENLQKLNRYN